MSRRIAMTYLREVDRACADFAAYCAAYHALFPLARLRRRAGAAGVARRQAMATARRPARAGVVVTAADAAPGLDSEQAAALAALPGRWSAHRIGDDGRLRPPISLMTNPHRWRRWDGGLFREAGEGESARSFLGPGLLIAPDERGRADDG